MEKSVAELLNRALERQGAGGPPVISITDAELRLGEAALKHITDEELEQVHGICRNIRERAERGA